MPAPAEIVQLVELFQRNVDQYRSPAFSEAAVHHQFIDLFFAALGWDVNNTQGFAEQYKEVVHEDKVHVGGATKAPDYSFSIGKERKFFVEANKPTVNIVPQTPGLTTSQYCCIIPSLHGNIHEFHGRVV